jgi:hypothetical protein
MIGLEAGQGSGAVLIRHTKYGISQNPAQDKFALLLSLLQWLEVLEIP